MCIIVDANSAHHVHAGDDAGRAVLNWLLKGTGKLVVSKDVLIELYKTKLRQTIPVLDTAGRLVRADEVQCEEIKSQVLSSGELKSDDEHVVALVLSSGCDLVYTHDKPLHEDLKNKSLVPNGCSIYQSSAHGHLLGACRC